MKRNRVYQDYLRDILDSIRDVREFIKGMKYSEFVLDKKTNYAAVKALEIIGEATKNIPASLRRKYPEVPWSKMAGIRNRLVHEYFGIDYRIVWQTITQDIPPIEPALMEMLKEYDKELFDELNGK